MNSHPHVHSKWKKSLVGLLGNRSTAACAVIALLALTSVTHGLRAASLDSEETTPIVVLEPTLDFERGWLQKQRQRSLATWTEEDLRQLTSDSRALLSTVLFEELNERLVFERATEPPREIAASNVRIVRLAVLHFDRRAPRPSDSLGRMEVFADEIASGELHLEVVDHRGEVLLRTKIQTTESEGFARPRRVTPGLVDAAIQRLGRRWGRWVAKELQKLGDS